MYKIRPTLPAETGRIDRPALAGINFEDVFAITPSPLLILNRDLVIVYANAAYLTTTGCALSEIQDRYVFEAFPETEDRVSLFRSAFQQALDGTTNTLTTEPYAIPVDGGGMREVVWTCTHAPLRNADGEVEFVMQNALDITEKHRSELENRVLIRELGHRVKNSLATMQAITRMSLIDTKSIAEAREDLLARMHAMSEVQNLLVDRSWRGIHLDGPPAAVSAKQAQALSMALHELATNAAKYGALSNDDGTVHVTWTLSDKESGHLALTWREAGGPTVLEPTRKGFGTTMLTRILAQEIKGEIAMDYRTDGLVCTMEGWLEHRT